MFTVRLAFIPLGGAETITVDRVMRHRGSGTGGAGVR